MAPFVIRLPAGIWVSERSARWAILIFALVLGLSIAFMHRGATVAQLTNDGIDYHGIAVSLISNHTYDSTYRPPGYPAFVALVYLLAGPRPGAVFFAQALLLVLTLPLVYKIALHITESKGAAVLVMGLCAIWPNFYWSIPDLLTELPSAFLVAACIWSLLLAVSEPTAKRCAVAGLLLGLNALVKVMVLPFLAAAPLLVLLAGRDRRRRLAPALVLFVLAIAVIVPWTVRNYIVTGRVVPVTTGGGANFWLGNWPGLHERGWDHKHYPEPLASMLVGKSEAERDRIMMRQGMSYIRENPRRAAGIFLRKFSHLWLGALGTNVHSIDKPVPHIGDFAVPKMSFVQVPLFIAAVVGWFLLPAPARRRAYPVLALLVVWTVAYVIIHADRRYAVPVECYKILFAGAAVWQIWTRLSHWAQQSATGRPAG